MCMLFMISVRENKNHKKEPIYTIQLKEFREERVKINQL